MQEVARRILLVDDTASDRLKTKFLLEGRRTPDQRATYIIEEATKGESVVAACERFLPDCVLLDYWLPDMTGLEVLSSLRQHFDSLQFAVVLLTGSGDELLAVRALKAGAQDYIPKSSVTDELLERSIQNALDKLNLERQRQAAEVALAANERKLRDIINAAPCALYTVDLVEGRSLYVSGFSHTLVGYTAEEIDQLSGPGLLAAVHPDDRATVQGHIRRLRLAADGEILECEFRIRHKQGSWHWLTVRDRIVARDEGGLGTAAAGAATDITHRKQMEEELHESQTQLVVAQEAAGIGTWAWDLHSPSLTCSSLFMQLYGRGGEPALRQNVWDHWIYPEDRRRVADDLTRALSGEPFETEFRTVWPDDTMHWLRSQGKLTRDGGRIARLLGATLDVTAKKRTEDDLRRSNDDLERFAYVASHDLQEPLRTISSFSELFARRNKDVDGESKQYLEYIRQGGQRMQALISDLLTFSRITQAGQEPLEEVDCNEALAEALNALQISIEESNAQIEAVNLPRLQANFQQITQLFQNLIGNAIKYRSGDGPVVRLTSSRIKRGWEFCVSDNGIGFDMAYSDRIFEAFKRLHSRDQYSGTGIGLAICKRIVERHGGRIWAESALGAGSKFFFTVSDVSEAAASA